MGENVLLETGVKCPGEECQRESVRGFKYAIPGWQSLGYHHDRLTYSWCGSNFWRRFCFTISIFKHLLHRSKLWLLSRRFLWTTKDGRKLFRFETDWYLVWEKFKEETARFIWYIDQL